MVKINNSDYADATKNDFKVAIKKFYKVKNGGEYPKKVRWIKSGTKKCNKKLPDNLVSKTEVEKLIDICQNERDRCLISVLYESGMRIGEIGSMRIKHVKFDKNGVIITAPEGKTGGRRVRLIESERYLRNWLNAHPRKNDLEEYLWVKLNGTNATRMGYDTIRMMLKKKARKAKVPESKVNPHNFRHARATELAQHFTEAQMCEYFGWVQGSNQAATYVHLSGRDLDKKIMEMHGLREEKEDKKEPRRCYRCGKVNPPGMNFCGMCQAPLDPETAMEVDRMEKETDVVDFEDPELLRLLAMKLRKTKTFREYWEGNIDKNNIKSIQK